MEHYNGTAWTITPTASVPGGILTAVTAVSASDIWAIGSAPNAGLSSSTGRAGSLRRHPASVATHSASRAWPTRTERYGQQAARRRLAGYFPRPPRPLTRELPQHSADFTETGRALNRPQSPQCSARQADESKSGVVRCPAFPLSCRVRPECQGGGGTLHRTSYLPDHPLSPITPAPAGPAATPSPPGTPAPMA